MGILDCKAETNADGHDYTVHAVKLPADGDQSERIEVTLTGVDPQGAQSAGGVFILPPSGLTAVGRLLNHIMTGLSTLHGRAQRPAAHPNAGAPWTEQQDSELLELWLAAGDTHSSYQVRRNLAARFGRSLGSIRARLLHVGCNPDAPGHAFALAPPAPLSATSTTAPSPAPAVVSTTRRIQ